MLYIQQNERTFNNFAEHILQEWKYNQNLCHVHLNCSFCQLIGFKCPLVKEFWPDLSNCLDSKFGLDFDLTCVIEHYFSHCYHKCVVYVLSLSAKYLITNCKCSIIIPIFIVKIINFINNKKSVKIVELYYDLFLIFSFI